MKPKASNGASSTQAPRRLGPGSEAGTTLREGRDRSPIVARCPYFGSSFSAAELMQ
jgi:hypothetical protein